MNGNYQLPRREELRSQCSLKKEHRSNENEMMGLSANVAWYLIIVAPPEMLTLSFIWLLLLQFKCLKRSYFEITARIFIFPTLKQKRGWLYKPVSYYRELWPSFSVNPSQSRRMYESISFIINQLYKDYQMHICRCNSCQIRGFKIRYTLQFH